MQNILRDLLNDPECGDITIICKDGQRKALRRILKSRSEYLQRMLDSQFAEGGKDEIRIDLSMKGLNFILTILYTDTLPEKYFGGEFREAYCTFHLWNETKYLEKLHEVATKWKSPFIAISYLMEEYPVTEKICVIGLNRLQMVDKYSELRHEVANLGETTDLFRKAFLSTVIDAPMTEEKLRKLYQNHRLELEAILEKNKS